MNECFDTAYDCISNNKEIEIDRVNWLIKPHPYEYKFQGHTRDIFEKLKWIKNVQSKYFV